MTFTNFLNKYPESIKLFKVEKEVSLIVHGQGVFIFKSTNIFPCYFMVYNDDKTSGLRVEFTLDSLKVNEIPSNKPLIDENNVEGLSKIEGAYYWFSIDSQNMRLSAGIGEARIDTCIYDYTFIDHFNKKFLESLTTIEFDENNSITPMRLLRDPVTISIPLLVKDTDELSMDDIASGTYMPKANLSLVAQKLYDCISGKAFVLDDDTFPEFSKAIEYSIATPGLWCHEKLKEKANEFSKEKPNVLETYLRITLGENNGESPGIPYVMEIWPVGHYSPIHNHGAANAIIRVLHGSINVSLFPFLSDKVDPFDSHDFNKDDFTWISPTLNQVHQLKNLQSNADTCITIQSYMYDQQDTEHYDYFDYMNEKSKSQQYEPDSDMDFIEFKNLMREEWENRPKSLFDILASFYGV
jgi:hypothetical protein